MGGEVGASSKPNVGSTFWLALTLDNAPPGEIKTGLTQQPPATTTPPPDHKADLTAEIMPTAELLNMLRRLLKEDDFSIVTG